MVANLETGQKVSLQKDNEELSKLIIGLGWDQIKTKKKGLFAFLLETPIDCDASVFMLQDDKLHSKKDIVCFKRLCHYSNSVLHTGDNLTGAGDGDDEQIIISLDGIPESYNRGIFVVNIYRAQQRKQHFGMIHNAFIRIVDATTNIEMYRYNLTEDYTNMTAMIFGEIHREDNGWKFNAIGKGTYDLGIDEIAKRYI
ncbi:stress protein [Candidatus Epulonipiscium fishelsonii]|uniref:Stress protein n=1 Tax=Candidatus Epulonipiscium fishelsonii TaxID=77094 RepID=A0ACC8XJ58_9FIRM|nr:stress protein [Epulopiscium sp. SCG-D08WGA-EpuloA1]